MSVPSSGEIVQLASFEGGEVDFGAQDTEVIFTTTTTSTTTMASSKAGKPASATSSKGSKQPTSILGKSGKGGSR
jgi:K+-transporting ATPase A subunit